MNDTKFCPECGTLNSRDALLCSSCGKKFNVVGAGGDSGKQQLNPRQFTTEEKLSGNNQSGSILAKNLLKAVVAFVILLLIRFFLINYN